ncbi:hypothetical protein ACXZ1K_13585 [Pedobacter sp. PWIIR3]
MKKLLLILIASLSILLNPSHASTIPVKLPIVHKEETIVYITKTGTKYHLGDCSYLRQSKIKITLKEAKADGYTACSRCKP